MILTCECGSEMSLDEDKHLHELQDIVGEFNRAHKSCRQAYVLKTQAEARRALMVKIEQGELVNLGPGEILTTLDAPDYTEALNKIAEHLSNIEHSCRNNWQGGPK